MLVHPALLKKQQRDKEETRRSAPIPPTELMQNKIKNWDGGMASSNGNQDGLIRK